MPAPRKGIDIVLKISERCNLACTYCYFFFQEMDTFKDNSAVIKTATVKQLVHFVKEAIAELGLESVNIGLHGGEPLLVNKARFASICEILQQGLSEHCHLKLMCQTNGTLVDEEWIDIFAKYKVHVGVSIDGPQDIHDLYRIDHNGKGSYHETVRGIKMLAKASQQGIIPPTGALCVANVDYDGAELVRHMHQDLGITNFDLLFPREGYDSQLLAQQDKWVKYFDGVLDYWFTQQKGRKLCMNTLNRIFSMLMSGTYSEKTDEYKAMQHNIINISSDGVLGIDDNILSLDNNLLNKNTTIFNTSLNKFMQQPLWQSLISAVDEKPESCDGCEWYRSCRAGALFNRYKKGEGFGNKTVFCQTMDHIHNRIAEYLVHHGLSIEEMADILATAPTFKAKDGLNTTLAARYERSQDILRIQL